MMAVSLGPTEVEPYLQKLQSSLDSTESIQIDIACINSPYNVTLSGTANQLNILQRLLLDAGTSARILNIDMAYHSRFMTPLAQEYRECLQDLRANECRTANRTLMFSSVTGDVIYPSELRSPDYWVRNMTSRVRFSDAISRLVAQSQRKRKVLGQHRTNGESQSISDLVEIGPHHALRGPVQECLRAAAKAGVINYYPSLIRPSSPYNAGLAPLAAIEVISVTGKLWSLGYPVNLLAVNSLPDEPRRALRIDLPEYVFNHSKVYWRESRISRNYRLRNVGPHDVLGVRSDDWNDKQAHWRNLIDESRLPWLRDHQIGDEYLYPGGAMVSTALEAAWQLATTGGAERGVRCEPSSFEMQDVQFLNAFRLVRGPDGPISGVETRFTLSPVALNPKESQFHMFIYVESDWLEVCRGRIRTYYDSEEEEASGGLKEDAMTDRLQRWDQNQFADKFSKTQSSQSFNTEVFYNLVSTEHNALYGPAFQTLDNISMLDTGEVMADISTRKWADVYRNKDVSTHILHPATMDGVFQLVFPALLGSRRTVVPTRVRRMWVNARGLLSKEQEQTGVLRAQGVSRQRGPRGTEVNVRVTSPGSNKPLMDVEGYESTVIGSNNDTVRSEIEPRRLCATMQWRPDVDMLKGEGLKKAIIVHNGSRLEVTRVALYNELHLSLRHFLSGARKRLSHINLDEDYNTTRRARHIIRWIDHHFHNSVVGDKSDECAEIPPTRRERTPPYSQGLSDGLLDSDAETRVLLRLAQNISDIALGQVEAHCLLSETDLLEYRREVVRSSRRLPSLLKYIDLLGHKNPQMRILEIGAATGGLTEVVATALVQEGRQRWGQYHCTDPSTSLLQKLQEHLGDLASKLEFRRCDPAEDVAQQGFTESSYDIVLMGDTSVSRKIST